MRNINELKRTPYDIIEQGQQALSDAGLPITILRQRIGKLYMAWTEEYMKLCDGDPALAAERAATLNRFTEDFFTALVGLGVYLCRPAE